jgi:hypothetical protein
MGIVLVLFVDAVRYGMVRYRGLLPPEIREYGTVQYGTVVSRTDSCAGALHVSL